MGTGNAGERILRSEKQMIIPEVNKEWLDNIIEPEGGFGVQIAIQPHYWGTFAVFSFKNCAKKFLKQIAKEQPQNKFRLASIPDKYIP